MFRRLIAPGHELRIFRLEDAEELFALTEKNRDHLHRWLPWVDATGAVEDTRAFIASTLRQAEHGQGLVAGILLEEVIVGVVGYHAIDWERRAAIFGYWLAEAHQGHGLMTASVQALLVHAFTELELATVELHCATGNLRSRAVAERLGFVWEATIKGGRSLYGRLIDMAVYVLPRERWRVSVSGSGEG